MYGEMECSNPATNRDNNENVKIKKDSPVKLLSANKKMQ